MNWSELETNLERAWEGPLPGHPAQERLSPRPRVGWEPGVVPEGARRGAGLLLLFPDAAGTPVLVLTVREAGLSKHAGQVSLPGGAVDPGETLVEAALREAHEEIGIRPDTVHVRGPLSPLFIPASGFVLHPFVGTRLRRPEMEPEPGEVARILEVPLSELTNPVNLRIAQREYRRQPIEVPYVEFDGERVWGATAMILAEFLALIHHHPDPWGGSVHPDRPPQPEP